MTRIIDEQMAVYTQLSEFDITELLSKFDLSSLQSFQSATDGIQNTTYFLTLSDGQQLVLTLFENRSGNELPFYISLTRNLNKAGLPVPCPLRDKKGGETHEIFGKPVLLFPLVKGRHLEEPNSAELNQMGLMLAKFHLHSLALPHEHANPLGIEWMQQTLALTQGSLSQSDIELVKQQVALRLELESLGLPRAVIHADLFRDNVLFHDGEIAAVIDFFDAGTDCLILDIAVVINDWCLDDKGLVDNEKRETFLKAYEHERKLIQLEKKQLNSALKIAATCVWLSRTKGQLLAKQGHNLETKNPDSCKELLKQHASGDC
jgi:homoserine kinase type II|tara:strand:+ start:375 stop:1331 length:957 start_codon:yes stop_codon:yes gene_type:complete